MIFEIKEPATITVIFTDDLLPVTFKIFRASGMLYFFREIPKGRLEIKVNIKHTGNYESNVGQVSKIEPMIIRPLSLTLPTPDRYREKDVQIVYNSELTKEKGGPARHYTEKGIIEIGPFFKSLPFPIRYFILLHEYGHFFYSDETNADLYAAKRFIDEGYNNSNALYALTRVLRDTPNNLIRILNLDKNLNKR